METTNHIFELTIRENLKFVLDDENSDVKNLKPSYHIHESTRAGGEGNVRYGDGSPWTYMWRGYAVPMNARCTGDVSSRHDLDDESEREAIEEIADTVVTFLRTSSTTPSSYSVDDYRWWMQSSLEDNPYRPTEHVPLVLTWWPKGKDGKYI